MRKLLEVSYKIEEIDISTDNLKVEHSDDNLTISSKDFQQNLINHISEGFPEYFIDAFVEKNKTRLELLETFLNFSTENDKEDYIWKQYKDFLRLLLSEHIEIISVKESDLEK